MSVDEQVFVRKRIGRRRLAIKTAVFSVIGEGRGLFTGYHVIIMHKEREECVA